MASSNSFPGILTSSVATSASFLLLLSMSIFMPSCLIHSVVSEPVEDKRALLDFLAGIPHRRLNWNASTSACTSWVGVVCNADGSRIVEIHLPGVALTGHLPTNTLGRLTALQTISLRSNALSGPFPPDFLNLSSLIDLHLQDNRFTGPLPTDLSAWRDMTALDLSFNGFDGSLPPSISNLTLLTALNLANNNFTGEIPNLDLPNLVYLNLSNNHLVGSIPKSLQNFPNSSFSGNDLTPISNPSPKAPLSPVPPPPAASVGSPPGASSKIRVLSESATLGIVVGGCALIFVMLAICLIFYFRKKQKQGNMVSGKLMKGDRSPGKAVTANPDENNRLVFFEGCNFAFDLEDLLRASAEVLGKGMFGTAYKAALEDSTTVVVKRLKDVGVGKREFEQQMEILGRIKHENVVELRAYYYSKDEKLIVYDYHSLGSVFSMLHGKRGEEGRRTPLDWETRLKIALGAARGIAHIHTENNGRFVHGNIKTTNVFLNHQLYGCISDVGLASLMNPMISPMSRTVGYRAPEVADTKKATQMSDVYSFGVLLLELLTGKSPIQVIGGGDEIIHLVRWVQSVVREEWTAEVFDVELMRYPDIEEDLVEMLQIAMSCVVRNPEQRPKMPVLVKRIQDVRRSGTGTRPSSETSTVPTPVRGQASSSVPIQPSFQ